MHLNATNDISVMQFNFSECRIFIWEIQILAGKFFCSLYSAIGWMDNFCKRICQTFIQLTSGGGAPSASQSTWNALPSGRNSSFGRLLRILGNAELWMWPICDFFFCRLFRASLLVGCVCVCVCFFLLFLLIYAADFMKRTSQSR